MARLGTFPRKIGLAGLAALILVGAVAYVYAMRVFLDDTARRGESTLQLAVTSLRAELVRYERLPPLIADHPVIDDLALDPGNPGFVAAANDYLRQYQQSLGASDLYFMDLQGITRAASNHDSPTSFINGNFAFRPYFADALKTGQGRYYALGTTSGKRGYYFGGKVTVQGAARGVLAVKIDLDALENAWSGGDYRIIVTDPEGVVFLSSEPAWLFTSLTPLTADQRARLAETRRYADRALGVFPVASYGMSHGQSLLSVAGGQSYLSLTLPMAEANWTIRVLLDTAPARRQAIAAALSAMLALGSGMMMLIVVVQRRARLRERLMLQEAAKTELERRVEERTFELAQVNSQLGAEVKERRLAEENLRKAQSDLIQAGKLAALGQMSAALSHEFNQPLGAARTYADNALTLLDRDRPDDARANLGRILSLIDRMGAISKHLRSFARSPTQRLIPVDLAEVIEATQEIAQLRLRAAGATLLLDLQGDLPMVMAGPVRLQQVLVNLLTNAADAVEGQADRRIHLSAVATAQGVRVIIRDHGPGVPLGLTERIFDPFFSTKGVGKGLGLGLSISYNIVKDFGGNLHVQTAADGGAEFVIDLTRADALRETG